jgi:hypothetical protein
MGGRGRVPRQVPTDPASPPLLVPAPPPWLPPIAAKTPLKPRVPCLDEGPARRVPKVSLPPEERPPQLLGNALSASAPRAPGDGSPPLLEPFDRFRADTPPNVPAGQAAAENGPLPRPTPGTLGLVDLAFEPGGQESAQAPSPPVSCPLAPHVHVAIVRGSYEALPSPFQRPVEPVADQVGPERGQRPPWGHPVHRLMPRLVRPRTRLEKPGAQGQHAPVPNARGDLTPHLVVVDPGETLLQVPSHHPGVALLAVRLRPLDRVVRMAARSASDARIREGGSPWRLEHRPHRLLDDAVHDGGNPACPDASRRFRTFHARHCLRVIGPCPQGRLHPRPVRLERGRARLDRHPRNPWASAMALDVLEGPTQVVTLPNPFHETCICGRTLGGGRLLGRFALDGPG